MKNKFYYILWRLFALKKNYTNFTCNWFYDHLGEQCMDEYALYIKDKYDMNFISLYELAERYVRENYLSDVEIVNMIINAEEKHNEVGQAVPLWRADEYSLALVKKTQEVTRYMRIACMYEFLWEGKRAEDLQ